MTIYLTFKHVCLLISEIQMMSKDSLNMEIRYIILLKNMIRIIENHKLFN